MHITTPKRSTRHAVDLSPFLHRVRAATWDQPHESPAFLKVDIDKLELELRAFCNSLREAMSALPDTPPRGVVPSKEEMNALWHALFPVKRSYKMAARFVTVLAWSAGYQWRSAVDQREVARDVLYGVDPAPVRRYFKLDSYLWRKTKEGKAYIKTYSARPEVKARRRLRESTPDFRSRRAALMRETRARAKDWKAAAQ